MENERFEVRRALSSDLEEVRQFYFDIIDGFAGAEFHPGWEKDIYPAPAQLRSLAEKGELYLGREDGKIVAAMAMNHEANEGYEGIAWQAEAERDEVFVLHMLGVHPSRQRNGVAGKMVRFAVRTARERNAKAIRLDVLRGNLPANRLYESAGFRKIDTVSMYYPDTGVTDFELYELVL